MLTVMDMALYEKGHGKHAEWKCVCNCGREIVLTSHQLRVQGINNCGCLREYKKNCRLLARHNIRKKHDRPHKKYVPHIKHGMSRTRQYGIWQNMIARCSNEKIPTYIYYGGRGIVVCDNWLKFEGFWKDMKDGYADSLTLDRINNAGNYEPSNCRWATKREQQNNTRYNVLLTYNGKTQTMSQWARTLGVTRKLLEGRICLGWDTNKAFETPVLRKKG